MAVQPNAKARVRSTNNCVTGSYFYIWTDKVATSETENKINNNIQSSWNSCFLDCTDHITAGLFHRAILMSGSAFSTWSLVEDPVHYAVKVANSLNCTVPSNMMKGHQVMGRRISQLNSPPEGFLFIIYLASSDCRKLFVACARSRCPTFSRLSSPRPPS